MSLDVDSLFAGSAGTDNSPKTPSENISLAFDIGHSSIGWAVFGGAGGYHLNGCGTVVFAESCQNQKRAQFRRTRRHIVATKSRIRRLREVLLARGVLTADELDALGNSHPWLDAADVLRGKRLLSWRELWNVLRWYAHNRGYDGNSRWARSEDAAGAGADHSDEQEADTEKVKKAHGLLRQFGTDSMAETITEALAVDHNTAKQNGGRVKKSSRVYFKGFGAAFPREIVVDEVRRILEAHKFDAAANAGTGSGLRGLDDAFITGVVGSPKITGGEKEDWKIALPADWSDAQRKKFLGTRSARTYEGGLLFGQFVPRFDNRIIPACRITGKNTPSKHSAAFYRFRWMQTLGNVRVRDKIATAGAGAKEEYCKEPRPLTPAEIAALDTKMRAVGRMTQTEFKNAVREVTGGASTRQLEGTFMTDEMAEGLVLDPALATILSIPAWSAVYEKMSGEKAEKHRAIWRNKVFHSKVPTTLDDFLNWLKQHNINIEPLRAAAGDAAIAAAAKQSTKSSRKRRGGHSDFYEDNDDSDNENPATGNPANFGDPVQNALRKAEKIKYAATGRAPYCTEILLAAADEYAAGLNPKRAPAEDAAAGAEARQVAPDQSGDKSPHSIPRAAAHCETGTRSSTASRPTDVPLRTMECGEFSPLSPSATCRAAAGAGTGSAAAGVLHESPQKLNELASRPLAALTNNHLVRHRLTILEKLLGKLVAKYAAGDASKVGRVVVEVIRDLQEFSGLNDKQKAQLLGQKLGHHRRIAEELKIALEKMGVPREMSAGLIRKARIFDDQGRKCPYTGAELSLQDLLTPGLLDLDHIIPRSIRPSDSLDSLVLTFSEINKLKTNKTAWQFVQDCAAVTGGVTVNVGGEKGNKQIFTPEQFKAFVEKMPWRVRGGSDDDERRLRRRKQLLLTTEYKEREGGFLPKDLTQTSHLVKLAASRIKAFFKNQKVAPVVVHLPGSATGAVRKSWHPMGCLGAVIPAVKDADGKVKSKTDIRNITHLHHAVDAATLGWIATFLNRNQGNQLWEAMLKRNATAADAAILRDNGNFSLNNEGKWDLRDIPQELKDELIEKLGEFHVSVHIPATRKGLRVEETVWGVRDKDPADPKVTLVQRGHSDSVLKKVSLATGGETEVPMATLASKTDSVKPAKLLGYERAAGADGVLVGRPIGKLGAQKGVRVIAENYGVALDPTPTVIPYFKVHSKLRELAAANGGKWPRVLRNGMVISVGAGTYKGRWRIKSVKDNADGLALDLCAPDALNTQRTNVRLATLLRPESRLVIERGAL